ncbi:hypothetical protein GIB67_015035, partial [Kingdonia uniflora]
LNAIVKCMAHYNPFDNLQSLGDDSNTAYTGNNSSSNATSKKKRGLARGNNPGDVKASSAPEFVLREDWVKFVDYCNSDKFLAKSKRNKENRAKLIAPCTLGRTSMPITRHKLAEERGVTDEEIGRVEVYISAHTKKDKTIQCPNVIVRGELQNTMRKDPKSIRTGPNDAIAQNEELRYNNNELKFATEKLRKDLDALTKYVGNILITCILNKPLHHRNVNRYEYGWADSIEIKKPLKVSAPKYVDYLINWIAVQLDDEKIFPQKLGML